MKSKAKKKIWMRYDNKWIQWMMVAESEKKNFFLFGIFFSLLSHAIWIQQTNKTVSFVRRWQCVCVCAQMNSIAETI